MVLSLVVYMLIDKKFELVYKTIFCGSMILTLQSISTQNKYYFTIDNYDISIKNLKKIINQLILGNGNGNKSQYLLWDEQCLIDQETLNGRTFLYIKENHGQLLKELGQDHKLNNTSLLQLSSIPNINRETTGDYRPIESFLSPNNKLWWAENYRRESLKTAEIEFSVYQRKRNYSPYQLSRFRQDYSSDKHQKEIHRQPIVAVDHIDRKLDKRTYHLQTNSYPPPPLLDTGAPL